MIAFGVKCTLKDTEFAIEAILQVCGWMLSLFFLIETLNDKLALQEKLIDGMTLGLIIRNIRILNYMLELKDFRMIVETFKKFSSPFASMMLTLYVIMFIYAIIGQICFNGVVTRITMLESDTDYMYMMMNFNDFWCAMLTLFHISVENNWNETTAIYTDIMGSNWPRVYFVSYWVITVLMALNIIISFVLEIYTTVGDTIMIKHLKIMYSKSLMLMFPNDDDFIDYLQNVLQIGFMGDANASTLIPSRENMKASILTATNRSNRSPRTSSVLSPNAAPTNPFKKGPTINQTTDSNSVITGSILKKTNTPQ